MLARQVFHQPNEALTARAWAGSSGMTSRFWFRFKGGKGTAAAIALAFCLHWLAGTTVLLTLVVMALIFGRMVVGGLAAMAILPASLFLLGFSPLVVGLAAALPVLSVLKHRSNIRKIINGTKPYLLAAIRKAGKDGATS